MPLALTPCRSGWQNKKHSHFISGRDAQSRDFTFCKLVVTAPWIHGVQPGGLSPY